MLFTDIIERKRDAKALGTDEIGYFVDGLADDSIPAEQVSALAMAIYLNGMSFDEAAELTRRMADSGTVLNWSESSLDGPVVDKHSTGGVGDKVSFMLAPIMAACGCYVPMISGRGLGHTGGTTDKVESIPGYRSMPDFGLFRKVVASVGCAIIGQTRELAPADKRLYAIRDITATVASVPLITASILSKKIAAGLDGLVMDIKCGSGAFMETSARARELADSILGTAARTGLATHAIVTDMNQVLGDTAGNALEIREAVRYLRNEHRERRLDEVTVALCAQMLIVGGSEADSDTARQKVDDAIRSGRAAEKFASMVSAMGGPADFLDRYDTYLPQSAVVRPLHAARAGVLGKVDTHRIGNAIIELGGGRRVLGASLDLSVGFSEVAHVGDTVDDQRPLAIVHAASDDAADVAAELYRKACEIADEANAPPTAVIETIVPERAAN